MAEKTDTTSNVSGLISQIKKLSVRLRHERVDCDTNTGAYSDIKGPEDYERLCDHLKDLKTAILEFLVPLTEKQYRDRDSGISLGSRTSTLSLRDSFPVQETGDLEKSNNTSMMQDETSLESNITDREENMLNNSACHVRGRRSQNQRLNIASVAIPEEIDGAPQPNLPEHSSDEN